MSLPVEQLEIGIPQGDGIFIKTTFQRDASPSSCEPPPDTQYQLAPSFFPPHFLEGAKDFLFLLNFFQKVSQLPCNLLCKRLC
uniref:Uncharacterized protein n=1 Tax=Strigops habroptila TaxID=2489341 RepID=A0A672UNQ0_STRHB